MKNHIKIYEKSYQENHQKKTDKSMKINYFLI